MALTWADLRGQARRLLIDTNITSPRFTNEQMLDFVGWALDQFCNHTALVTATGFVGDGATLLYTLPNNVYEPVEKSGAVYVDNGSSVTYLNAIPLWKRNSAQNGYYTAGDTLSVIAAPALDSDLTINYFAYYPHPVFDTDPILTPGWATAALVYRIAAYAHSSLASKTAQIRQWGAKPDTGAPVDNPLMDQSHYYMKMYEEELWRMPRQERENYFRTDARSGVPKRG